MLYISLHNSSFGIFKNLHYAGLHPTSFSDWKLIDQVEQSHGRPKGKPREKVTSLEMMMNIIRTHSAQN